MDSCFTAYLFRVLLTVQILFSCSPTWAKTCQELFSTRGNLRASFDVAGLEPLNMLKDFVGENDPAGIWITNPQRIFGPSVGANRVLVKTRYLEKNELEQAVATIAADGTLRTSFDALNFIFVVTQSGQPRVWPKSANESSFARTKHSSLARGEPVLMAGEIELAYNGQIFRITNRSGHYQPPANHFNWFVDWVSSQTSHSFRTLDVSNGP